MIQVSRSQPTAVEQGVAADRLQLRSFLTALPAAAELGVRRVWFDGN